MLPAALLVATGDGIVECLPPTELDPSSNICYLFLNVLTPITLLIGEERAHKEILIRYIHLRHHHHHHYQLPRHPSIPWLSFV